MKAIMKKIQTGAQWSRYCLRSLFVTFLLMLTFGVDEAWGDNTATITRRALDDSDWSNIENDNSSSAYITWKGNDAGTHVTFKLSGGTFKNSTWDYFQSTGDQTHKLEWTVDAGYTISVKEVSLVVRSSLNGSTVKVGQAGYATNPYGGSDDFVTVSSGTYSPVLGNDGCVNIICKDKYNSANNFIKTVTITYTIEQTEKTVTFNSADFSTSNATEYKIWQDSVNFYLHYIRNWHNYGNGHFYIYTSETAATIDWTPKSGYTIAVTGVSLNGQNASEDHKENWYSISKTTFTGSSYVRSHTSSDNTEVKISQSTSAATYSYTTANNTNIFPSGTALGNSAYFKLRAEKGYKDADHDNSYEYQINTATLTYSVTPPAPALKNGNTVTANTVTLTDYFQPFNIAASMFYEVKKWNGSAYVAVESGFQINDNVFKATTVGVFQVVAQSDAIGAFTVSAASDPLTITVEEVHPLTIAVGTQELYVDGTTTMVITDQFNTTEEVVFDYDDEFFDYDEESGVLTAKNDGNASFNTIEKSIHVTQASYGGIDAVDMYIDFTIKKYANTLTCSWGEEPWSKSLNFDEEAAITFSSNNDTGTPIVVTPSPASSVATYDGTNNKIVANHRTGDVTWEVSQVEDYKYQAASAQTLTVNVGTIASNCYVMTENDQHAVGWYDNSDGLEYPLSDRGDKIYFKAGKYKDGATGELNVYGYNKVGTELFHEEYGVGSLTTSGVDEEIDISDKEVVKIKFQAGNTISKWFSNVRVTRKKWFDIENADREAITEIDMPSKTASGAATTATFYVDYSTCDDVIKVVSDHPHITVSDASFSSTTAGRKAITLTYSSSEAEEIEATVTIYTRYEHKTLTVNAETKGKLSTTLEYKGADSYSVDHANMNATDLFQVRDENGDLVASPTITLISNATGVINTVSSNTAVDFICGGSATITASYAGDAKYAAASDLGQTITVNKLSDAISWSSVGDDGKIHVWADTDIPTSIASAHTDIASYSVASANPYLSVTEEEGVYTLHAGIVGEVALTATSAGDCTYATASGSKTIAVDPREHAIIWDQDLEGIQTDDRGYIINRRITLNAYAVDNESNPTNVPVSYEITGGGTFATIENGNELVINVANLSGTLSTTITATTTVGTKYAIVSETKTISVVRWGTNTAKSADNTSDIVDGKIVINAPHATFTFSGQTAITEFGYATVLGKPEGYKLAQSLDNNGGSKTYNFSWVSTNANCSIQVNKISFWIKAYDSNAFVSNKAKVSFDGADEVSVGTAAMTANDGDFKHFSKPENYTNRNVPVVCQVTGSENFDFYIKNISIEYTVYTTAPSATGDIEQVNRTINASDKKTVDVRSLFSYATPAPDDFSYSYEIVGAPEHAFLEGGYMFWADAVGDYTVRAKVNMDEDHRESEWGSEKTIRVNKVPYVFNNSQEDQNWNTEGNWNVGSVPTSSDEVLIEGNVTVSGNVSVQGLTIAQGADVTLNVNGQLNIGSGNSQNLTGYGDLHVREGGQVNLSNGTLKVRNFTLDAALSGTKGGVHQNAASGQVANPTKLDVRGEAYFVLTIDPADALTYGWYDFTVPFEVEISNGIYRYGENTPMRSGVDFMIMEYSESRRASGMKGWVNASGTLQPGRAYTITLDKWAYTTYVFKKKAGASAAGTNSFSAVASDVESQTRGWNGLGNGSLSHAQLTDAFSNAKVQLYDHAHNVYVTKEANESNFAVGTAFFIQVSEAQTISFAAAEENRTLMAPSREVYTMNEFRLTLKDTETDNTMDRLWLSASEEATEEYVIGQDLLKMGTPTSGTVAQMWTMKGGKVLCDVETAMNGERATAPLSFYAPKAGQYELAIDQAPEDVTLYLTYNDQVIWILSFGSYVFDLEKGTTEGYGLRMETNRAPQIATGIDEQTAGAQNRKVMINNTLYIVTAEGAIFDVMGKNIK